MLGKFMIGFCFWMVGVIEDNVCLFKKFGTTKNERALEMKDNRVRMQLAVDDFMM